MADGDNQDSTIVRAENWLNGNVKGQWGGATRSVAESLSESTKDSKTPISNNTVRKAMPVVGAVGVGGTILLLSGTLEKLTDSIGGGIKRVGGYLEGIPLLGPVIGGAIGLVGKGISAVSIVTAPVAATVASIFTYKALQLPENTDLIGNKEKRGHPNGIPLGSRDIFERERVKLEEKVKELNKQEKELSKEIDKLKEQLKKNAKEAKEGLREINNKLDKIKSELKKLKNDIDSLRKDGTPEANKKLDELQRQSSELEKKIDELNAKREVLKPEEPAVKGAEGEKPKTPEGEKTEPAKEYDVELTPAETETSKPEAKKIDLAETQRLRDAARHERDLILEDIRTSEGYLRQMKFVLGDGIENHKELVEKFEADIAAAKEELNNKQAELDALEKTIQDAQKETSETRSEKPADPVPERGAEGKGADPVDPTAETSPTDKSKPEAKKIDLAETQKLRDAARQKANEILKQLAEYEYYLKDSIQASTTELDPENKDFIERLKETYKQRIKVLEQELSEKQAELDALEKTIQDAKQETSNTRSEKPADPVPEKGGEVKGADPVIEVKPVSQTTLELAELQRLIDEMKADRLRRSTEEPTDTTPEKGGEGKGTDPVIDPPVDLKLPDPAKGEPPVEPAPTGAKPNKGEGKGADPVIDPPVDLTRVDPVLTSDAPKPIDLVKATGAKPAAPTGAKPKATNSKAPRPKGENGSKAMLIYLAAQQWTRKTNENGESEWSITDSDAIESFRFVKHAEAGLRVGGVKDDPNFMSKHYIMTNGDHAIKIVGIDKSTENLPDFVMARVKYVEVRKVMKNGEEVLDGNGIPEYEEVDGKVREFTQVDPQGFIDSGLRAGLTSAITLPVVATPLGKVAELTGKAAERGGIKLLSKEAKLGQEANALVLKPPKLSNGTVLKNGGKALQGTGKGMKAVSKAAGAAALVFAEGEAVLEYSEKLNAIYDMLSQEGTAVEKQQRQRMALEQLEEASEKFYIESGFVAASANGVGFVAVFMLEQTGVKKVMIDTLFEVKALIPKENPQMLQTLYERVGVDLKEVPITSQNNYKLFPHFAERLMVALNNKYYGKRMDIDRNKSPEEQEKQREQITADIVKKKEADLKRAIEDPMFAWKLIYEDVTKTEFKGDDKALKESFDKYKSEEMTNRLGNAAWQSLKIAPSGYIRNEENNAHLTDGLNEQDQKSLLITLAKEMQDYYVKRDTVSVSAAPPVEVPLVPFTVTGKGGKLEHVQPPVAQIPQAPAPVVKPEGVDVDKPGRLLYDASKYDNVRSQWTDYSGKELHKKLMEYDAKKTENTVAFVYATRQVFNEASETNKDGMAARSKIKDMLKTQLNLSEAEAEAFTVAPPQIRATVVAGVDGTDSDGRDISKALDAFARAYEEVYGEGFIKVDGNTEGIAYEKMNASQKIAFIKMALGSGDDAFEYSYKKRMAFFKSRHFIYPTDGGDYEGPISGYDYSVDGTDNSSNPFNLIPFILRGGEKSPQGVTIIANGDTLTWGQEHGKLEKLFLSVRGTLAKDSKAVGELSSTYSGNDLGQESAQEFLKRALTAQEAYYGTFSNYLETDGTVKKIKDYGVKAKFMETSFQLAKETDYFMVTSSDLNDGIDPVTKQKREGEWTLVKNVKTGENLYMGGDSKKAMSLVKLKWFKDTSEQLAKETNYTLMAASEFNDGIDPTTNQKREGTWTVVKNNQTGEILHIGGDVKFAIYSLRASKANNTLLLGSSDASKDAAQSRPGKWILFKDLQTNKEYYAESNLKTGESVQPGDLKITDIVDKATGEKFPVREDMVFNSSMNDFALFSKQLDQLKSRTPQRSFEDVIASLKGSPALDKDTAPKHQVTGAGKGVLPGTYEQLQGDKTLTLGKEATLPFHDHEADVRYTLKGTWELDKNGYRTLKVTSIIVHDLMSEQPHSWDKTDQPRTKFDKELAVPGVFVTDGTFRSQVKKIHDDYENARSAVWSNAEADFQRKQNDKMTADKKVAVEAAKVKIKDKVKSWMKDGSLSFEYHSPEATADSPFQSNALLKKRRSPADSVVVLNVSQKDKDELKALFKEAGLEFREQQRAEENTLGNSSLVSFIPEEDLSSYYAECDRFDAELIAAKAKAPTSEILAIKPEQTHETTIRVSKSSDEAMKRLVENLQAPQEPSQRGVLKWKKPTFNPLPLAPASVFKADAPSKDALTTMTVGDTDSLKDWLIQPKPTAAKPSTILDEFIKALPNLPQTPKSKKDKGAETP